MVSAPSQALGAVGHNQAQASLAAAIKARLNVEPVAQCLIAILAQVKVPSELAEGTLRELAFGSAAEPITGSAQLALGAMARQLKEASPERAARIVAKVLQELNTACSENRTCHLLLVLGNSGAEEALSAIRPRLDDKALSVRVAAVSALRFIAADEAETILIQKLTADPESEVRGAAIAAFRYRPMTNTAFQSICEVLRSDKSDRMRRHQERRSPGFSVSPPPEANVLPSGAKASARTVFAWRAVHEDACPWSRPKCGSVRRRYPLPTIGRLPTAPCTRRKLAHPEVGASHRLRSPESTYILPSKPT
jgi:hypothetical protein